MSKVGSIFNKGKDFDTPKRVAFQTMELAVIEEMGVKIGASLNDVAGDEFSIQLTELTETALQPILEANKQAHAEYVAKAEADANRDNATIASIEKFCGFQKKLHGGTKAEMIFAGENIWTKSELVLTADLKDTLLQADKVEVAQAVKA